MTSGPDDGLLPGELPDSGYREDAEHWLSVYSELLCLATELGLTSHAERYGRRLRFWQARLQELGRPDEQS